jgi:hypothetical protein
MSDKIKIRLIFALAVLAIILGLVMYKKSGDNKMSESLNGQLSIIDKSKYSEDELKLLAPPSPEATNEAILEHSKLAETLAISGETVSIEGCALKPNPLVLESKESNKIKIKNTGKNEFQISFDGLKMLGIKPGRTIDINSELSHGPGLYGYLCEENGFKGLIGFVLLVPR